MKTLRAILPIGLGTLCAAASAPSLTPGLWQFTNTPEGASLDGRALDDLPYSAPDAPETICVTPAMAAAPAAFLARDSAACHFTKAATAGGEVDMTGDVSAIGTRPRARHSPSHRRVDADQLRAAVRNDQSGGERRDGVHRHDDRQAHRRLPQALKG